MKRRALLAALAALTAAGLLASSVGRRVPAPPSLSRPIGLTDAVARPGGAMPSPAMADAARGEGVFRVCSACHSIGRGGPDVDGPNLYGVVGARVAERRPRYGYTQALRDVGGIWTEPRLDAWLTNPAAVAPGTAMHFAGLDDARDRADVIAYLATQGPRR